MKKYYLLLVMLLIFPIAAFAEVKEIGMSDFLDAKNNPESLTTKGLKFTTTSHSMYCYDFVEGEYKFTEDIDLGVDTICLRSGDVVLDLNEKTISSSSEDNELIESDYSTVIKGNGVLTPLTNEYVAIAVWEEGDLTIENGTFNGLVKIKSDGDLYIKDGTFNGGVSTEAHTLIIDDGVFKELAALCAYKITINDGDFISKENSEVATGVCGMNIVINGGTFDGNLAGLDVFEFGSLTINGGTFIGNDSGLLIEDFSEDVRPTIILKGGLFEAESNEYGAIYYISEKELEDNPNVMLDWLSENFEYSQI